ncbi:hypothetical protein [uncultured Algimonas sp.]|uniref:hypothetical protein n=1 Tax=uncultured Algimonas sp. TaxID=1547920 RepID=UPI002636B91C|nr:hypothetical protein [uncultured Algimonas sp.]
MAAFAATGCGDTQPDNCLVDASFFTLLETRFLAETQQQGLHVYDGTAMDPRTDPVIEGRPSPFSVPDVTLSQRSDGADYQWDVDVEENCGMENEPSFDFVVYDGSGSIDRVTLRATLNENGVIEDQSGEIVYADATAE